MRRKILSMILSAVLVFGLMGGIGLTAQAAEPWQTVYADLLRKELADGRWGPERFQDSIIGHFYIFDIDKNGIPELIITPEYDDDALMPGEVFAFRDNHVQKIGEMYLSLIESTATGGWSSVYIPDDDTKGIYVAHIHRDDAWQFFYTLRDGVIHSERIDFFAEGKYPSTRIGFHLVTEANIKTFITDYVSATPTVPTPQPSTNLHPFATALREFRDGAILGGHTAAVRTPLQGFSGEAVIAIREIRGNAFEIVVFAAENGNNVNIPITHADDVQIQKELHDVFISGTNHIVIIVGVSGGIYVAFEYANGSFTQDVFHAHYDDVANIELYRHNGQSISEAEYIELQRKYGTTREESNARKYIAVGQYSSVGLEDHTNDILAMTAAPPEIPDWAEGAVERARTLNLIPSGFDINGNTHGQATTRAEFATLTVTLYESIVGEITGRSTFADTNDVNVQKAAAIGVVTGVGDNRYNPGGTLTREQAATMLSRLANAIGKPLTQQSATFADRGDISGYAVDAVGQMQATGIMGGTGNNMFSPKGDYTRAQSIVTIMRMYDIVNK